MKWIVTILMLLLLLMCGCGEKKDGPEATERKTTTVQPVSDNLQKITKSDRKLLTSSDLTPAESSSHVGKGNDTAVGIDSSFAKAWEAASWFWHITFWAGFFVGLLGFVLSFLKKGRTQGSEP